MGRHNISRAQDIFQGSANIPGYQGDKNGIQLTPMYRWRPVCQNVQGARPIVFTAALVAGALSATLNANWAGASGVYPVTLSNGQVIGAVLTNGANTCPFVAATPPPTLGTLGTEQVLNAVTANATVGGQPPLLGVANGYSASAAIAAAGNAVLGGANTGSFTNPLTGLTAVAGLADVPRNVVGAWTTASTVTVKGLDIYGAPMSEVQTGSAFTGKKAFSVVLSITSSAAVTAATFGFGPVLGLPFRVSSGDFESPMLNDLAETAGTFAPPDLTDPATTSTGDVRGTYSCAGALNGAKFLGIILKVTDPTTTVGAFGVTQV